MVKLDKVKVLALSALASALIVGCSSTSSSTESLTSISGVAVDPELQGATVFLDANNNGILDANELSTLTDKSGNYSLQIPQSDAGKPLVVTGGIDKVTKEPFSGTMTTISQAGNNAQNITPLTTLVQKYQQVNPNKDISTVKSELASKLGLTYDDFEKNTLDSSQLLKVALRIQKVVQKVASSSSQNTSKIYETLATHITSESDLDTAMTNTIDQEVASGTLDAAKVKDLDKELSAVSDGLSVEQLALSVDNIKTEVESATSESELTTDLASDPAVLVEDDTEVQAEKAKRTLDALGLGSLDTATQDKITSSDKIDLDNDSLDEIKKKLDNNEIGLSSSEQSNLKREQFFSENGLNNLDETTRNELKTKFDDDNFDFANASDTDFREKLNDDTFLGNDEDFIAKVQGEMNKSELEDELSDSASLADGKKLVGSIIKGPIDGAIIKLKDANGTLVTSSVSDKGIFVLPEVTLSGAYYTLESVGGSYDDEATQSVVNIGDTQGLKTLLTLEQLQNVLSEKEYIAITPETTIFTELVIDALTNGDELSTAMSDAKTLITDAMITNSSPMVGISGDSFLQTGDFTSPFPKEKSEAFARNRAISFSYMVRDLNLSAEQVFDVLNLVVADYKDGSADGIQLADGRDVNVSAEFALSRTKLFQNTTDKLRNGELSDAQKAQLKKMGFDTEMFNDTAESEQLNLDLLVQQYLNASTLPTLHTLPVISDEDGNTTDNKETYTLTATTDVNVTIQTPDGNWTTPMWRYNNNPLPVVIRTSNGTEMTLNLNNQLDSNSTIHWHGFKIPAIMDGGPDVPVESNSTKAYSFTMNQPAAPLWFHPHPDMQTGKQVYMGLAGVYILEDAVSKDLEAANQLPSGDKDTILLVQDRRFTDLNTTTNVRELAYKNMAMDSDGMLGDTVLVNGSVLPKQEVSNTLHRYRLYNVSNARNYDFALSDDSNFTVVGTDGGLLEKPVSVNHITLGAAERVEIVIDFSKYNVGDKVMLVSKPFNGDMMSMMGSNNSMGDMGDMGDMNMDGMDGMDGMDNMDGSMTSGTDTQGMMKGMVSNGTGLVIMRFDINETQAETVTLYDTLPSTAQITSRLSEADADNQGNEREFIMSMGGMGSGMNDMNSSSQGMQMSFVINAKTFDIDRVDEFVPAGATEIWSIKNLSPMAHPFHAHAIQYQILSRNGVPASGVDLGWKDTFLVQPGETVRVIGDFSSAEGDYMYHCHILEHEDAGMMGYFRVGDTGNLGAQ